MLKHGKGIQKAGIGNVSGRETLHRSLREYATAVGVSFRQNQGNLGFASKSVQTVRSPAAMPDMFRQQLVRQLCRFFYRNDLHRF